MKRLHTYKQTFKKKSFLRIGALVLVLLALPFIIVASQKKQQSRQYASAATPTIQVTQVDTIVTGSGYEVYGTFGSHNQKVVSNGHGIFISYLHSDYTAGGTDNSVWHLDRSTDGGSTFHTIYQESSQNSKAPTLETDENDNVYAISEAGGGSWGSTPSVFHRFDAAANYQNPLITKPVPVSSGKFTSAYDPIRKLIYYMTWNNNGQPDFFVIDLNGVLLKQVQLWSSSTTMQAHYPHLQVAPDGTLFAAWTNTDETAPGQDYYDARFIESPDGGNTWVGPTGTLTLPIASYGNDSSWEIVDSVDIKPIGTTQDNWLNNMAFNGNAMHFVYDVNFGGKEVYKRFNWSTKTFDAKMAPYIQGETMTIGLADGFFTQDTTATGRLYYVGGGINNYWGKVVTLYSDDHGTTWHDYASSNSVTDSSHQIRYLGGARRLMSDGSIIGTFTLFGSNGTPGYIYFFRSTGGTLTPTPTSGSGVSPTSVQVPTASPVTSAGTVTELYPGECPDRTKVVGKEYDRLRESFPPS